MSICNHNEANEKHQAGFNPNLREKLLVCINNDGSKLLETFLDVAVREDESSVWQALGLWLGDDALQAIPDRIRLFAAIDRDIAWLETLISEQLDAILHHPRFQQLEASWRGVAYLTEQFEPTEDEIQLRIIHWTWAELSRDLQGALEFDQSCFFKKIYTEELDIPGGKPFGILIGDYYVHHRRSETIVDDIETLGKVSEVAAAAFCPFVTSCRPSMFGLNHFSELELPSELGSAFSTQNDPDNRRWQKFRESDEARFIGIVLPRILMRLPYAYDHYDSSGLCYCERPESSNRKGDPIPQLDHYLWGNAAYAFAAVLIRAFNVCGWFADIRGLRLEEFGGGIVENLAVPCFETDPSHLVPKYSTEVAMTERRAGELSELGFIPLIKSKDTRFSWFFNCPSVQRPATFEPTDHVANINSRMSGMLHYILCVSRFGHYIKQIIRNQRIGSLTNPQEIENYLSEKFLFKYRESNENASTERKAAAPLRDYDVKIRQIPGRPGTYACTVYLQPHYQFDYVEARIRLDTEITSEEP